MLIVFSYKWITLRLFGDWELNQHSRKSTYGSQVFAHSSLLHDMASQRNKGTGCNKEMPFIVHVLHVPKRLITCTGQKCCSALPTLQTQQKKGFPCGVILWGWKWMRPFSLGIHSCEVQPVSCRLPSILSAFAGTLGWAQTSALTSRQKKPQYSSAKPLLFVQFMAYWSGGARSAL